jgi:hypothetical protein
MESNKNLLNYLDISFNKKYCEREFKKNGKFKYLPFLKNNNFYLNRFLCIVNKIILSNQVLFPYLYDIDEDHIVNKMLILSYIKKNYNLKYIYLTKNLIELYNNDDKYIEEKVVNYYFVKYAFENDINFFNSITNTIIKRLSLTFLYGKLTSSNKIKNKTIFIYIFYYTYIKDIDFENEIYKKYNLKISKDFANYNDLYIFLKNKGYVDKFYNNYTKKIIKTYKKTYKKILNHPLFNEYIKKQKEEIKLFSDIDILKMVDSDVDSKFNKKYIKNKFIQLSKKYNI